MKNQFYSAFDTETASSRKADDYRTPFQVDRDRIIHTSAFRRLQSKTQVFLSGQYDFYRTRLTHSIEVAQIGRSICAFLKAKGDALGEDYFVDADLVEAVCLSHDLGHPPFGHTGERSLNRLMADHGGFEGNAQTLRMLTETIYSGQRTGMAPTRAFLDGVLKYKTLRSELGEAPPNHFLYDYQHTFLDFAHGGRDFPVELTPGPERDGFRSIECQIMDWADDTAYSVNDVADGIRAGFVTLESLERWANARSLDAVEAAFAEGVAEAIRQDKVEARFGRKIGECIGACSLRQDSNFLSGESNRYRYRLEIDPHQKREVAFYKRLAFDLVFRSQQLSQLDHKADHVLGRLFGVLFDRYVPEAPSSRFRLLPGSVEEEISMAESPSERGRIVCDAVAAMTDAFAVKTYKRLFDADFGSIVDLV